MLVSLADHNGEVIAAAGYRPGDWGPLFLEQYLSAPIETYLVQGPTTLPERNRLVEVGHLAATRTGAGRRLILLLGPHLAALGFQWVIGTLTQELRQLFLRLGVVPLSLAEADPALLGAEISRWGSYYDHCPVVLAGRSTWPCRPSRGGVRCHEARPPRRAGRPGARAELAARTRNDVTPPAPDRRARVRDCHGQRAGLLGDRRSGERRRVRSCALAALLHAGADAARCRGGRRRRAARRSAAGRAVAGAALGACRRRRSIAAVGTSGPEAGRAAAGHRQDHLHLGNHGSAQGRVPERQSHAAGDPEPGRCAGAARDRAPSERTAVRSTAREHRRPDGAAPPECLAADAATRRARPERIVQLRRRALPCRGAGASAAQHHPPAADAAGLVRLPDADPAQRLVRRSSWRWAVRRSARAGSRPLRRWASRPARATVSPKAARCRRSTCRERNVPAASAGCCRTAHPGGRRRRARSFRQPVQRLPRRSDAGAGMVADRRSWPASTPTASSMCRAARRTC